MTAARQRPYDPCRARAARATAAIPMIAPAAINRLSTDMRAALAYLLGHDELVFAAGYYVGPGGERHRGTTIGALVSQGLVVVSSPRPRHSVARLTVEARPILRTAMAEEADALAAQ